MKFEVTCSIEILYNAPSPSTAWPESLPSQFQRRGFQYSSPSNAVRSDVDGGPPYQRPRYSARIDTFTAMMILDDSQLDTLLTFYHDTLAGGALPFDHDHPISGDQVVMRFDVSEELEIVPV